MPVLCLLQSDTADSELNNANFLRLIGGAAPSDDTTDQALDHTYEEFLKVLNSDPDFTARACIFRPTRMPAAKATVF